MDASDVGESVAPRRKKTCIGRLCQTFRNMLHPSPSNVRSTTVWLRGIIICSLLVIGGLAIAALVVVAGSINQSGQDSVVLLTMTQLRQLNGAAVNNCTTMLLYAANATALNIIARELTLPLFGLTTGVFTLRTGDTVPNSPFVLESTITSPEIEEQWSKIQGPINRTVEAILLIQDSVLVRQVPNLTPAMWSAANVVLEQELQYIIPGLRMIQILMSDECRDSLDQVRSQQYIFMLIILAVLLVVGLFAFYPMDRRIKHLFNALTVRADELKRVSDDLSILTKLNPNSIIRILPSGEVSFINERCTELLGLNLTTAQSWLSLLSPEDRATMQSALDAAFHDKSITLSFDATRFVRMTDGRELYLVGLGVPEPSDNVAAPVRSIVLALTDVTETRAVNEQRLEALQAAGEMQEMRAREAIEHRSEQERFVDMICHEIRNPLNGVVNNLDMLMDQQQRVLDKLNQLPESSLREEIRQLLAEEAPLWEAIEMCSEHQRRITDDVLEVSRMRADRLVIHERAFNLSAVAASVYNTFVAEARSLNIELSLEDTTPTDLILRSDPQRIQQVLSNLLSNAVKFTANCPVRRVSLKVSVAPTDEQSVQAAVEALDRVWRTQSPKLGGVAEPSPPQPPEGAAALPPHSEGAAVLPPHSEGAAVLPPHFEGAAAPPPQPAEDTEAAPPSRPAPTGGMQAAPPTEPLPRGKRLVMVTFAVRDTGIGLTDEQRQRLFKPFHQATPKTYGTYGGSGMGLFICRGLATLLHATIFIESTLKVGSTFTFRVPCAIVEEDEEVPLFENLAATMKRPERRRSSGTDTGAVQTATAAGAERTRETTEGAPEADRMRETTEGAPEAERMRETTEGTQVNVQEAERVPTTEGVQEAERMRVSPPPRRYRILVAEDNDINRTVLRKQLETAPGRPYDVTLAVDGLDAVEKFEAAGAPLDLIIMDVEMPNMDGLEATERIRAIERERGMQHGIPIIGLSGNARQEQVEIALGRGMSGYLAKPCRQPALLSYLERYLSAARQ